MAFLSGKLLSSLLSSTGIIGPLGFAAYMVTAQQREEEIKDDIEEQKPDQSVEILEPVLPSVEKMEVETFKEKANEERTDEKAIERKEPSEGKGSVSGNGVSQVDVKDLDRIVKDLLENGVVHGGSRDLQKRSLEQSSSSNIGEEQTRQRNSISTQAVDEAEKSGQGATSQDVSVSSRGNQVSKNRELERDSSSSDSVSLGASGSSEHLVSSNLSEVEILTRGSSSSSLATDDSGFTAVNQRSETQGSSSGQESLGSIGEKTSERGTAGHSSSSKIESASDSSSDSSYGSEIGSRDGSYTGFEGIETNNGPRVTSFHVDNSK